MNSFENEHTYSLILSAQNGDEKAKSQITEENLKLVYSVAKRFYNRGYDDEDINQIGCIGLLKAIQKFDLSLGVRFSTYAVPLIMGEIRRFLRDDGPIKVSRSLKNTATSVASLTEKIQKEDGRTPGILELSKSLGVSVDDIMSSIESSMPPESLFAARGDDNTRLCDFLADKDREIEILDKLDIKLALKSLPKREQTIIFMRYFFDKTQAEVSKKLGISQVQVSRIEKKILDNFRQKLRPNA